MSVQYENTLPRVPYPPDSFKRPMLNYIPKFKFGPSERRYKSPPKRMLTRAVDKSERMLRPPEKDIVQRNLNAVNRMHERQSVSRRAKIIEAREKYFRVLPQKKADNAASVITRAMREKPYVNYKAKGIKPLPPNRRLFTEVSDGKKGDSREEKSMARVEAMASKTVP